MIWVTWRQFRGTVLAGVLTPLLVAVVIAIASSIIGPGRPNGAFNGSFFFCFQSSTAQCLAESTLTLASLLTIALPVLLGIFVGVTVFSRDIERRTHVLGLTQSVSRERWYWTRMLVVFVPIVLAMLVLGFAMYWLQYQSFTGPTELAGIYDSRLAFPAFGASGVVPAGYTALGLGVGSTVALLLRHTIGAMIATLVIMIVALVLFPSIIREHYATPEVERVELDDIYPGSYASYSQSGTDSFYPRWTVASDYVDAEGQPVPVSYETCEPRYDSWPERNDNDTAAESNARYDAALAENQRIRLECLRAMDIDHFENRYFEDRLFWRFQRTEMALCFLLTLILLYGATPLVRRLKP